MSAIKYWSETAASNNAAAPNGWPEGMAPSSINNSARENMAAVRAFYANTEWREFADGTGTNDAHTAAYASATTFALASGDGDVTAIYHAGRRVRVVAATPGTIYGTIASSTGNPTTVTVSWDTATEMSSEAIAVSLGMGVTGSPLSANNAIVDAGGSAGQYLGYGPAWTSGAFEVVQSTDASAVSTITFVSGFDAGYDHEFVYHNLTPDVDDILVCHVREVTTYISTSNAYRNAVISHIDTTPNSDSTQTTNVLLSAGSNVDTGEQASGRIYMPSPASAVKTILMISGGSASTAAAGGLKANTNFAEREAAAACTGVRFSWVSANNFTAVGNITQLRRKIA